MKDGNNNKDVIDDEISAGSSGTIFQSGQLDPAAILKLLAEGLEKIYLNHGQVIDFLRQHLCNVISDSDLLKRWINQLIDAKVASAEALLAADHARQLVNCGFSDASHVELLGIIGNPARLQQCSDIFEASMPKSVEDTWQKVREFIRLQPPGDKPSPCLHEAISALEPVSTAKPGLSVILPVHHDRGMFLATFCSILCSRLERKLQLVVVTNTSHPCEFERFEAGIHEFASSVLRLSKAVVVGEDWLKVIQARPDDRQNALNVADRVVKYPLRVVVNANTQMSANALQRVADAFEDPNVRLVVPQAQYVHNCRSRVLLGYYRLWESLPYVRNQPLGHGFYCFDEKLRSRILHFPAGADNKFVFELALADERCIISNCYASVKLPDDWKTLIEEKTKWTLGNIELERRAPMIRSRKFTKFTKYLGALWHLLWHPIHWPSVPTFILVYCLTRRRAKAMEKALLAGRAQGNDGQQFQAPAASLFSRVCDFLLRRRRIDSEAASGGDENGLVDAPGSSLLSCVSQHEFDLQNAIAQDMDEPLVSSYGKQVLESGRT